MKTMHTTLPEMSLKMKFWANLEKRCLKKSLFCLCRIIDWWGKKWVSFSGSPCINLEFALFQYFEIWCSIIWLKRLKWCIETEKMVFLRFELHNTDSEILRTSCSTYISKTPSSRDCVWICWLWQSMTLKDACLILHHPISVPQVLF